MPKKTYHIENLDCANCAAKIEAKINALPQVEQATIVFPTRQLRLTAADPDSLLEELTAIARTVEGEVTISQREHRHEHRHHEHHEHCDCGHDDHGCACGHHHGERHHHEHDHDHGDSDSPMPLLIGGGLFAIGLGLGYFGLEFAAAAAYIAAYLVLGLEILKTAAKNLIKGHVFDENFLMSIATLGAFLIGEFPEAVGVMLFYRVGEFFEHKAVERSETITLEYYYWNYSNSLGWDTNDDGIVDYEYYSEYTVTGDVTMKPVLVPFYVDLDLGAEDASYVDAEGNDITISSTGQWPFR